MNMFFQTWGQFLVPEISGDRKWRDWLRPAEFCFLLLFAFFLPLREAPKTIFWALYTVIWLTNRFREGSFGGKWNFWDGIAIAWVGSGILAAVFAGIPRGHWKEWSALNDMVMCTSLLFCLRRAGYQAAQWTALFAMLTFSCLLTEGEGFWLWKVAHLNGALELKSVGHVNHSAIYLVISFGLAMSLALSYWASLSRGGRFVALLAPGLLLVGVFMCESRAAVGVAVALFLVLLVLGMRGGGLGKVKAGAALGLLVAALLLFGNGAIQKHRANLEANHVLSFRDQIWKRGMVAWRAYPVCGVGTGNFGLISDEQLKHLLEIQGKECADGEFFSPISHAHNIYVNTLVERGAVGILALLTFLLAWGASLLRCLPKVGDSCEHLMFWGGAFSGWFVTVVAGSVNTTLHHEHGLLAMMTLGGWLAWRRRESGSPGDLSGVSPQSS